MAGRNGEEFFKLRGVASRTFRLLTSANEEFELFVTLLAGVFV